ncbi:MAG: hypothetical protein ACE367_00350 [Acidimicrobiales bacterium]
MGLSTSTLLRPVHAWFFVWEDVLPSVYRVVAVVSAAALTTLALRAFGIGPTWLVAIAATLAWIALAVAQEHDERVCVPVDQRFVDALRECLDPVMAGHGWTFGSATGGCRARKETATTVVYDHHGGSHRMAWIVRDAAAGTLDVRLMPEDVDAHPEVATQLVARGHAELAERLRRATEPESDAHAVRDAFAVVLTGPA